MGGDRIGTVEQTNVLVVCRNGEGPTDVVCWYRVAVGVETYARRLVDANRRDQIDIRQGCWQLKESRLFLLEQGRDGLIWVNWVWAPIANLLDEFEKLSVAVGQRVEGPGSEEAFL